MSNSKGPKLEAFDRPALQVLESLMSQPISQLAKSWAEMPIDWDQLGKPPFFVPNKFAQSDIYRGTMVYSILQMHWRAERSLSPDEAQIVAMQKSKYLYTVSYAIPVIFGTATLYTMRGRDQFRFPFFTPGDKFKSNVFPTKSRPWLKGIHARAMWHSCRFVAYLAVSQWAISSFFVSYALTVRQVEFEQDPRLNNLRSSVRKAATERMASSKNSRTRMMAGKMQQDEPSEGPQGSVQPRPRSSQPSKAVDQQFPSDQQLEDERYQREQQQYQQEYQPPTKQRYPTQYQQPQTASSPQQPTRLPWQNKRDEDDGGLGLDDYDNGTVYDDASPVAPAEQSRKWPKPGATSGSAWDRLRKLSTTSQAPVDERDVPAQGSKWSRVRASASPDADKGSKTEGDYMYNLRDEEKELAKDKAQRDFDAMLDKERRGENDADTRRKW